MELSIVNAHMKAAGFGIMDFRYDAHAFGSWFVVVEASGKCWRLIYDGRDGILCLEQTTEDAGWNGVRDEIVRELSDEQKLHLAIEWMKEISSSI